MNATPTVTSEQAQNAFRAGKLCINVEYRSSKCEPIEWTDKTTKQLCRGVTLTHSVENDEGGLLVSERIESTFDWKAYKPPFRRGQRILVFFRMLSQDKGVTKLFVARTEKDPECLFAIEDGPQTNGKPEAKK